MEETGPGGRIAARALAIVVRRADGGAPSVWPHPRVYCRLRLHHHWRTISVEDGTSRYRRCEECGLDGDLDVRTNPLPMNRSFWGKNP